MGILALIILLVVVAICIGFVLGVSAHAASSGDGLSKKQKTELKNSRLTLDEMRRLALKSQEIEPNVSTMILDEYNKLYANELN